MLKRFAELEASYHPAVLPPPALKASFCDAATAHSGSVPSLAFMRLVPSLAFMRLVSSLAFMRLPSRMRGFWQGVAGA